MSTAVLTKTSGHDRSDPRERTTASVATLRASERLDGVDRRGPFRPEVLVSTRARMTGQNLARGFRLLDAAAVIAVTWYAAGHHSAPALMNATLAEITPFLLSALVLTWALESFRAYDFRGGEGLGAHLVRIGAAGGLTALVSALAIAPFVGVAGLGDRLGLWFALALNAVIILHVAAWLVVRRWRKAGKLTPNVVIVGATQSAERLVERALASGDVAILGIFDDRSGRGPQTIHGVPVLGTVETLIGHRIMPCVDKVVVAVPTAAQPRVRDIISRLAILPNPVTLVMDADGEGRTGAVAQLASSPLTYVSGGPRDESRAFAKRAQDVVLAGLGLIVALPVMGLIALAIRLDSPGPALFRQKRHGFNNEEIVVWKFRSMRVEVADAHAHRQVSAGDDRITRVGRFIRRTSLDELPQIINVLKGEMSLVGPRPHAIGMKTGPHESARLVAEYAHRHRMKPGLTGWAAINGSRGPVDTPELVRRRVALDIEYIERQNFWLDLYIIMVTIPCLLGDRSTVR